MNVTSVCDGAFKKAVLLRCYAALSDAGFTRYRKEDVDWPLWDGFHGWIGLNSDLTKDHIEIIPFFGVHVEPIMRLYTGLEGRAYRRSVATYAVHAGHIAPNEAVFRFTTQTDIDVEVERLTRLCTHKGLTYARSIASYPALLPLIQQRVSMLGGYPERFAACLYLMGKKEDAHAFVEDFLKDHREYFASFAIPFLDLLK